MYASTILPNRPLWPAGKTPRHTHSREMNPTRMNPTIMMKQCGGLVTGLKATFGMALVLALASAAEAGAFPPSETVLPATTRAWLSVADVAGLQETFDATQYGQLIKDPHMQPFVESVRAQMQSASKQRLGKLGLKIEDLEKIPGGEVALATIEPAPGTLATVLLVDTTGHAAETASIVTKIEQRLLERKATKLPAGEAASALTITAFQLPADPDDRSSRPSKVAFALLPDALVVGDDPGVVTQTVAQLQGGRKDSLATVPAFKAVMARCGNDISPHAAPIRWFIDPLGFAQAVQAANPPREKRKGPDYVAILARQGFDAVKGAGGVVLFDDGAREARHQSLIYAPPLEGKKPFAADRFKLAARMLQFPNVETIHPQAWVPRDVSSWVAMQWDIKNAFGSVESLVDDVVGEKGVFDDVIASLKEDPDGPQIDVEKELVACLGTRVSVISDYATPIDTDCDRLVIAIETTDEARVAATVAKSMGTDPDMQKVEYNGHQIWELIDRSSSIPKLEIETPGGAVAHADVEDGSRGRRARMREGEEKLLPHSAVTVANGHLFIASHRDILERVLSTEISGETLQSASDYAFVSAEIARLFPQTTAFRSFGRSDESILPAYEMLRRGEMPKSKSLTGQLLNGLLGDGKEGSTRTQKLDGSTLPEFETIRKYFGTVGVGMESVPEGWYVAGVALPRAQPEPEIARLPVEPVGR